ncbi:CATRA conflict system CASPASE/TPR repeat-associated protein [Streptomyces qinglanensis]|uniref:CATRA conflict system CASPASE/TPR repeat-associated protein n=1 Tax=Streptomyces qinglanensis TaxID=943816 RepID=UPI0011605FAD|nr:CATRA conflict system CASPASE/TPR repeat-associated protein [Streptomyces qinglanensis]
MAEAPAAPLGKSVELLDEHLVLHLVAPLGSPRATAAYDAVRDLWTACRHLFAMDRALPGSDLPRDLPATAAQLLRAAPGTAGVRTLAAQENAEDDYQAVLRRHHDVLSLSVALAPRHDRPGWRLLTRQWEAVSHGRTEALIGDARVYLARLPASAGGTAPPFGPAEAEPAVRGLLPHPLQSPGGHPQGVTEQERLHLWELAPGGDERSRRDFLLVAGPDDEARASAWCWSSGGTSIPPLARYLLHAAKLRYQLRVWRCDNRAAELRARVDEATGRPGGGVPAGFPGTPDPTGPPAEARRLVPRLRSLRRTVDIAADNMARALGSPPPYAGPFADDHALAAWLSAALDDEAGYLADAVDRWEAEHGPVPLPRAPEPTPSAPAGRSPGPSAPVPDEARRNVFVVHGRELTIRAGMFAFLRALGLRPLEWESLVESTAEGSPFLGELVARGIRQAGAVVVLLTPEDTVQLHPRLCAPGDPPEETLIGMQARPNVLLELGMALAHAPARTVIVRVGAHRPIADLAGRNFIQLEDTAACRRKLAQRLRAAGAPVDDRGQDWLTEGTLHAAPPTPSWHGGS